MKLTKRQALELTVELWTWIAEQNKVGRGVCKIEWPGWKCVGEMEGECPCCEYTHPLLGFGEDCAPHCPVLWPEGEGCLGHESPFLNWVRYAGRPVTQAKYARAVTRLAKKALKDLDKEVEE